METKKERVTAIFNSIAPGYDLMNTLMSLGLDKQWRRLAVRRAGVKKGGRCLDLCCGTSKLTMELAKAAGPEGEVLGVDCSIEMLNKARDNLENFPLGKAISLMLGDASNLSIESNRFDCAVVGWGLRNVDHIPSVIKEMVRVVKPGGKVVSIDMGKPNRVIQPLVALYTEHFIPSVAKVITGNPEAYQYLDASIKTFLSPEELTILFDQSGLVETEYYNFNGGIVSLVEGRKPFE